MNTSLNVYLRTTAYQVKRHLRVSGNGKGVILQLFRGKVRQDIGNISGNIRSGGKRKRLVAIATNGHFPALDVEVEVASSLWSTRRKQPEVYIETHGTQT